MSHHPCFQYPSCIGSENNKKAPTTVLIKGFDEGGFSVNNFEQSVIGYRDALQAHIQFHDGRIPARIVGIAKDLPVVSAIHLNDKVFSRSS